MDPSRDCPPAASADRHFPWPLRAVSMTLTGVRVDTAWKGVVVVDVVVVVVRVYACVCGVCEW